MPHSEVRTPLQRDRMPECAVLLHSTSRPSARVFWPTALLAVDRHFPLEVCAGRWYFSFDRDDDGVLPGMLAMLRHQPVLIERGDHSGNGTRSGWGADMLVDLRTVREPWVWHVMDDLGFAEPLPAASLAALLQLAEQLNASTIAINEGLVTNNGTTGWWRNKATPQTMPPHLAEALPGVALWRAQATAPDGQDCCRTPFVVQQNFGLWHRATLEWTLRLLRPSVTPNNWELVWNIWGLIKGFVKQHNLDLSAAYALRENAYALEFLRPGPLQAVLDIAHQGELKRGFCACAWLRMVTRLGVVDGDGMAVGGVALPNGSHQLLRDRNYAWCRASAPRHVGAGAGGDEEDTAADRSLWRQLPGSPPGCGCPERCTRECGCAAAAARRAGG